MFLFNPLTLVLLEQTTEVQTAPCPLCHQTSILELKWQEVNKLEIGLLIQEALPERDKNFRELLISGTHPECWDKMFKEES